MPLAGLEGQCPCDTHWIMHKIWGPNWTAQKQAQRREPIPHLEMLEGVPKIPPWTPVYANPGFATTRYDVLACRSCSRHRCPSISWLVWIVFRGRRHEASAGDMSYVCPTMWSSAHYHVRLRFGVGNIPPASEIVWDPVKYQCQTPFMKYQLWNTVYEMPITK